MDICGEQAIFLPSTECGDCGELYTRVAALEALLQGKRNITIAKTDSNGNTVTINVLGQVM